MRSHTGWRGLGGASSNWPSDPSIPPCKPSYIPFRIPTCPPAPLYFSPHPPPPPCSIKHALSLFSLSFPFLPLGPAACYRYRHRHRRVALTTSSGRLRRHLPPSARQTRRRHIGRRHLGDVFRDVGLSALGKAERWWAPGGDGRWSEGAG
jgi:hypothetical protein